MIEPVDQLTTFEVIESRQLNPDSPVQILPAGNKLEVAVFLVYASPFLYADLSCFLLKRDLVDC